MIATEIIWGDEGSPNVKQGYIAHDIEHMV